MPKYKVTCDIMCTIEREIEAEDEDAALEELVIDESEIIEAIQQATYTVDEIV